jgi:hypothetical protein
MSKLEKLDLMGVASLGIVTAALLVGWIATTHDIAARHARQVAPAQTQAVALTEGGSMKLTVTAARDSGPATTTRTASVRPSGGPALEVGLPFVFRP